MDNNYTYPVILDFNEDNYINMYFPDFKNACTCSGKEDDYITIAQDYLAITLADYEDEKKDVPEPSKEVKLTDGQKLIYINIWMPYHRSKMKEVYVKKTLTIPSWLDILAKNNNVNFSSTLVKALKLELNIE